MTNEELIILFVNRLNVNDIKEANQYEAELLRLLNERDELEKALQEERYDCAIKYAEVYGAELKINELEKQLASTQRAVEDLNKIKILVDSGSINTGDDMKDEGYLLAISDVRDIIYLTRKERERK